MPTLQTLAEHVPPRFGMPLRAFKNRRHLFGLHAPPSIFAYFVSKGQLALDIGANRGLYAFSIARFAEHVHAFEPNPVPYKYLSRVRSNITAYPYALSDSNGFAKLVVPANAEGEARISDDGLLEIETRTLDSFRFRDVGLIKIDVEGHEMAVLRGAALTLEYEKPNLFIELEDRHRPSAVATASSFLRDLGYGEAYFMQAGRFYHLSEFSPKEHQERWIDNPSSPMYVSNFYFSTSPLPAKLSANCEVNRVCGEP